jgi:hypothetical protein
MKFILLVSLLFITPSLYANMSTDLPFGPLKPFQSDGCSNFADGTKNNPNLWNHCCVVHDQKYWAGGSYQERLQADRDLGKCVASTGNVETAKLMYVGVRLGGSPFYNTQFRWGFGWNKLRGYTQLTLSEHLAVQQMQGDL